MNKTIVLSVHGLVDFLLRKGDIDNRIYNSSSMLEGTRIHLRYQQIQNGNYLSEQYLETKVEVDDFIFSLNGRADGIIIGGTLPIIDEIKTTVAELEYFYESQKEWHLGQAKVYAYMYAKENSLDKCGVRLTYISQKDNTDKLILNFTYTYQELEEFVRDLCKEYLSFYLEIANHEEAKKLSCQKLTFPYEEYRRGQRELAKYVYGAILNHESVFIEAPTGIGKTMSTLFPAVKSFGTMDIEKIFYLSAKNVAKQVAFEASQKLIENGLIARVIKLQSKEKMCRCDSRKCNPDECPFTKGYYDKLVRVTREILEKEMVLDEDYINDVADREMMCPFELQLDLSLFCDIIICDYNYLFDPLAYLKRFFDEEHTNYVALIDEAHNLVDRSRDMYSTVLDNDDLKNLKAEFKHYKAPAFKRALKKVITYLDEIKEQEGPFVEQENNFDDKFYSLLEHLFTEFQDIMKNEPDYTTNLFLEEFRQVNKFLKLSEFISPSFHTYFEITEETKAIIRCIDSSYLVKDSLNKLRASIFFSATLTPIDYYINCLGGNDLTPKVILDSPFPKDNLLTIVRNDISTRLKDRALSYEEIASIIKDVGKEKIGNYLVFFSSYAYLENVAKYLEDEEEIHYIKQERDMLDIDKARFLNSFKENPETSTIGLAVLGGVFSEGIDLVGSRLIGTIIVGVGLPTISYERDKIKDYFTSRELNGFDYAYVFPGMNKVMQAAGRVIRGEEDKGVVIFIDDRFSYSKYKSLLKEQYRGAYYVNNNQQINHLIESFWKKHQNSNKD